LRDAGDGAGENPGEPGREDAQSGGVRSYPHLDKSPIHRTGSVDNGIRMSFGPDSLRCAGIRGNDAVKPSNTLALAYSFRSPRLQKKGTSQKAQCCELLKSARKVNYNGDVDGSVPSSGGNSTITIETEPILLLQFSDRSQQLRRLSGRDDHHLSAIWWELFV
jgi:hypothetical protein